MSRETPRIKLPAVEQIGVVVADIDRAIEFYSATFGLGPFQVHEVELDGFTYRNQQGKCRLKMALAQSGPIEIELIQVLDGKTPHSEFLREKGEGLHHLRFRVDAFSQLLAQLAEEGIEAEFHQTFPGIASFAYLDSNKTAGVVFELFQIEDRPKQEG